MYIVHTASTTVHSASLLYIILNNLPIVWPQIESWVVGFFWAPIYNWFAIFLTVSFGNRFRVLIQVESHIPSDCCFTLIAITVSRTVFTVNVHSVIMAAYLFMKYPGLVKHSVFCNISLLTSELISRFHWKNKVNSGVIDLAGFLSQN